jgi:hypothetical protein
MIKNPFNPISSAKKIPFKKMGEYISYLNDEPFVILYSYNDYWGVPLVSGSNMTLNHITLSDLCKKQLGFSLKFKRISPDMYEDNSYAKHIMSGDSGDLIFPKQLTGGKRFSTGDHYWCDRYIRQGIYKDLTPYIERFCPEAIIQFERYPEIKAMCVKEGKTYAIYAGMPDISVLTLIAKNDLLNDNGINIQDINNFDALFEFMKSLYQGREPTSDFNKIMVNPVWLFKYAVYNSGYYPMNFDMYDVVFKINDERCIPYLVENTEIFPYFMECFSRFFTCSYFTSEYLYIYMEPHKNYDLYITANPLFFINRQSRFCTNDTNNFFTNHSIVLFDDQKVLINDFTNILLITVPEASEQPEKALIFMQWLMTNQEAADILTFGSRLMGSNHFRYSYDGTIIPEKYNTIYVFYNLVSNFSEKAFLSGNKDFDISQQYKELTLHAEYPTLYNMIDAQHPHYLTFEEFDESIEPVQYKRKAYIDNCLSELMNNPDNRIDANKITTELYELTDTEKMIEDYREFVRKIFESGEVIYGN